MRDFEAPRRAYVYVLFGCILILACSQPRVSSTAASIHDLVFQVGLQQGSVAMRDQRNNTRVIVTDTGGVTLGSETDEFGIAKAAGEPPDGFEAELGKLRLTNGIHGKEIYRSELAANAALEVAGQKASTEYAKKRFMVIYEWSRYGTIPLKHAAAPFTVVKGDFGFAVRLVLDVEIQETKATVDLRLGPGNLDAALALGVATVSARYQVLGTSASFLPTRDIDIRSAKDLTRTTEEFHTRGQQLERKLAECGKVVAFDEDGKQVEPVDPKPAYCTAISEPTMLAYVSFGPGIGDRLREYQLISAECNAYRSQMYELKMKKAKSKNARLSKSEWRQHNYLEEQFVDCGQRLSKLMTTAAELAAVAKNKDTIAATEAESLAQQKHQEAAPQEERLEAVTQEEHLDAMAK